MCDLIKVAKLQTKLVELIVAMQQHSVVSGIPYDVAGHTPLLYELSSIQAVLAQGCAAKNQLTGLLYERYVNIFRQWKNDLRRLRKHQLHGVLPKRLL